MNYQHPNESVFPRQPDKDNDLVSWFREIRLMLMFSMKFQEMNKTKEKKKQPK